MVFWRHPNNYDDPIDTFYVEVSRKQTKYVYLRLCTYSAPNLANLHIVLLCT